VLVVATLCIRFVQEIGGVTNFDEKVYRRKAYQSAAKAHGPE